jgi:enoyl-CoA hydratase/carnithine racemase
MSAGSPVAAAVLHSDADGIRRITLNRPEAANALRPVDRGRLIEAMAQEIQSAAEDSHEGVRSFVERRPPEFTGW